jgi:hypothetical protein
MKKILLLIGFALFLPQPAMGCTIPVFRYALEKWELTQYEILVSHRGPLPVEVQKLLKQWSKTPSKANIDITIVDLDEKGTPNLTNNLQHAWKREGNNTQEPWMHVRYMAPGADFTAWSGPCTTANLLNVLDSPMRRAILAHLTRGASTVFVLMNSDDAQADQAALKIAWDELRSLEQKIKLPEQSKDGPQIKLPLSLKVSFPLLVLDRKRPEEAALIRLLLASEPGIDKVKGPILFPIFGRGRVLGTLSGKELNEEQIQQVAKFLCRECSCQVKELNPGVDLLVAAEWNGIFDKIFDGKEAIPMPASPAPVTMVTSAVKTNEPPPSEVSVKADLSQSLDAAKSSSVIITTPSRPTAVESEAKTTQPECMLCRNWLWIAIGVAGALVLGTGAWAVFSLRK